MEAMREEMRPALCPCFERRLLNEPAGPDLSGGDQPELGKMRAEAGGIAREQAMARDRGMRRRRHSPRVSAMISSVVMAPSPRPRMCATNRAPRPLPALRRARRMRTVSPSKSSSTLGLR